MSRARKTPSVRRHPQTNASDLENGAVRRRKRGVVLLMVLVVIVGLAFSSYAFTTVMQAEQDAAQMTSRRIQSRYLVDSGVEAARLFLSQTDAAIMEQGGVYNNATQFQSLIVFTDSDEQLQGYATFMAPAMDDLGMQSGFRYGLTDESTKLNLNVLPTLDQQAPGVAVQLLLALPGMTDEVADCILDYIDADDEPRDYGVEVEYYSGLSPPYAPTNGPLESIEELLMVRGVTPELLFGYDDNHNGVIDGNESSASGGISPDMALGWANYLTLWSKERNYTAEGLPRIYLNQPDMQTLYDELSTVFSGEWANFIVGMRIYGPYTGEDEPNAGVLPGVLDLTQEPTYDFNQVLDIVDAVVEVQFEGVDDPVILSSPVRSELGLGLSLPMLLENCTTVPADAIPGRVNIAQCPRAVMLGIPGMTEELADTIIDRRELERDDEDPNRDFETWLLVEGLVDLSTMRSLMPFVCVGGDVYRAEIVGYYNDGMAASRAEVVIDRTGAFPRIVFWRDKSHLPLGYDIEALGTSLQQ